MTPRRAGPADGPVLADHHARAALRLLDLRHLAMLAEVARRGNFSAAAEATCFTPSAVSQ
jgi:hypothetical protein